MTSKPQETTDRVTFRWRQHESQFAALLAESAREAGRPPSDHARDLLKTALGGPDEMLGGLETLHHELAQLREQMRQMLSIKPGLRLIHDNIYELRDDLAVSVIKLLVDAGNARLPDAEAWVKEALDAQ